LKEGRRNLKKRARRSENREVRTKEQRMMVEIRTQEVSGRE
jgi:hypothetical protein